MAEKVELVKNDDIEDIKRAIKRINTLMKSFANNMKKLDCRMGSIEETNIMVEKVELAKKNDIADIKWAIKCINALMKCFADNMKKLDRRMDSLEEDMDMAEIFGERDV